MTKIVKSPKKKQSAKITKLKMRVGEIANMLLQNNPKMVRMRSGGSSGYADLFMSKQLMKGGMSDDTRNNIVGFLKEKKNIDAVIALKKGVIANDEKIKVIEDELYKKGLYDYNLCDKYNNVASEDLKDDLITLDIVQKFYLLVKDKQIDGTNVLKDEDFQGYDIKNPDEVGAVDEVGAANRDVVEEDGAVVVEGGPGTEEPGKKFNRGDIVTIENLVNNNEYNGMIGTIISYNQATDRWEVRLTYNNQKKKLAFKSQNLTKKEDVAATGDRIILETGDRIILDQAGNFQVDETAAAAAQGGKPPAKYKSTGRIVHIMYKKRNYKRTVYVKGKRNTKYCKIDGEYILLSKMKVIEGH